MCGLFCFLACFQFVSHSFYCRARFKTCTWTIVLECCSSEYNIWDPVWCPSLMSILCVGGVDMVSPHLKVVLHIHLDEELPLFVWICVKAKIIQFPKTNFVRKVQLEWNSYTVIYKELLLLIGKDKAIEAICCMFDFTNKSMCISRKVQLFLKMVSDIVASTNKWSKNNKVLSVLF